MKKLEDIPKKNHFQVPEGYFDDLPLRIQARISAEVPARVSRPYSRYALQYALPAVVIMVVAFFLFKPENPANAENILASIDTEDLVFYLEQSDITTEEILDKVDFNTESVEAIESEVYGDMNVEEEYLDALLFDLELDSNSNL